MKRNITFMLLAVLGVGAALLAYPHKPNLGIPNLFWGWSNSEGYARPAAVTATGAVIISTEGAAGLTIATMPAAIAVSISTITADLATGSNPIGYVGGMPHETPTMSQLVASTTSQSITAPTDRIYVTLHNLSDTLTIWVYPAATATQSEGIPLYPESSLTRYWDSSVPVSYVASDLATFTAEQAVKP